MWQHITLSSLAIQSWIQSSVLHRGVGLLEGWRPGSRLLQWGDTIAAVLIALVLGLTPFVSTDLVGVLLLACAGFWGLLTIAESARPSLPMGPPLPLFGWTPIHVLLGLYWGIATVAMAFSPVKAAAFSGWIKLTLYLLLFVLSARVMRSPRLTNGILTVFLGVALVIGAYGVRQEFFGVEQLATWNDPTSTLAGDTRVYSYLENPNLLAGYLIPAIAFSVAAVFVWPGRGPKVLAGAMVLVNLSCLYFTDSRGGWIGAMAMVIAFLLLLYGWWRDQLSPFWQKWLLPMVFGALAGFLLAAILSVETLQARVLSIFQGRGDSSNNFRINVWEAVRQMIRERPILGIGPGNDAFNKVYPLYMRPGFSALSAYSVLMEIIVETGFLGFTVFVWFLGVTFCQGWQQMQRLRQSRNPQGFWLMGAIASGVGLMVHGLVDTVWYRPEINTVWWLAVAVIASHYVPRPTEESVTSLHQTSEDATFLENSQT